MISFFRKIRQKLLSQNRVTRYLAYSVGEILLVVIGILIALQVNNWNDSKKNREKETYFLKRLEKEFSRDSASLAGVIKILNLKVDAGRELKTFLENPSSDQPKHLIRKTILGGRVLVFRSFTPSYDEALASGQLSLIRNDSIKDKINYYKGYLDDLKTFSTDEGQKRKSEYNEHVFKYFDAEIAVDIWEQSNPDSLDLTKYKNDLVGFTKDPSSSYHVKSVLSVDRETSLLYKRAITIGLNPVLESIRKEISARE